jgi:hypothetical protein
VSELRPSRMSFVGLWEASSDLLWRVRQLGVIILVDVINTGSFLPLLSSWGSPRGLKGWLYADDSLRDAELFISSRGPRLREMRA